MTPIVELTDLEMMQDPGKWPHMFLPVKSRDPRKRLDGEGLGILLEGRPIVYFVNMWDLPVGFVPKSWFDEKPKKEYESFETLVSDWTVD